MLKQLLTLFFSLIFVPPVFAGDTAPNEPQAYYDDRQHGWYWYEKEEIPGKKVLKATIYKFPLKLIFWKLFLVWKKKSALIKK